MSWAILTPRRWRSKEALQTGKQLLKKGTNLIRWSHLIQSRQKFIKPKNKCVYCSIQSLTPAPAVNFRMPRGYEANGPPMTLFQVIKVKPPAAV